MDQSGRNQRSNNSRAGIGPIELAPGVSGKVPPQNVEAEASLLGSILIDKDAIIKIADQVTADDFYTERHALIYSAIVDLYEKREPLDLLTLSNKLREVGELEHVGGSVYLADLTGGVPTAAHVEEYAKIVSHKATLRRLIGASSAITNLGYDETTPLEDLLDKAEQTVFDVSQKNLKQNFIPINSILAESFERLNELNSTKGKLRGIPTGFRDMDKMLAGLQPSDLFILAARPSMGKTTLVMNLAHHVAAREGIPVGFFSLEVSKEQLIDQLLAIESGVDSWKLRTGALDDDDFPKIAEAMAQLSEAPLFIDDSATTNVMEMRTKARRLQSEHGLGLVIIDYLQLISGGGRTNEGRQQEVSEISRGLKGLARELNVPVIALSQLSRAVESRDDKRPMLSDLRDSGSIEQDADVVGFIYRPWYYDKEADENITEILIRKHRNGPIGDVELYFNAAQRKFTDLDRFHG
ncbi:replicative DNA helicase [Candidatus Saccharibacteria bacterium]|nr:replicative DNA helicase [Candidatus Saccharibacteria bacterium]